MLECCSCLAIELGRVCNLLPMTLFEHVLDNRGLLRYMSKHVSHDYSVAGDCGDMRRSQDVEGMFKEDICLLF